MYLPQLHDRVLIGEEELEVEIVAIDREQGLFTVYDDQADELSVYAFSETTGLAVQVKFVPAREPWQAEGDEAWR